MTYFVTLMYHNLEDNPNDLYSVCTSVFHRQFAWLKDEGFVIEGFPGLEMRLAQHNFSERYVVMSFDDGHTSNLHAAEILCANEDQAIFF